MFGEHALLFGGEPRQRLDLRDLTRQLGYITHVSTVFPVFARLLPIFAFGTELALLKSLATDGPSKEPKIPGPKGARQCKER
jgi:hypothetical protein